MGMYTELYISCGIKQDVPKEVRDVLFHLFGGKEVPEKLPDHPFFQCSRWDCIGSMSSFYFVPMPTSRIEVNEISKKIYITSRSDLKNYGSEIEHFLDWIMPYVADGDGAHIGHMRYEEDREPTILYKTKGE